jgi:hypothetical protein
MTTTDYIINAALILIVVRHIREKRLDLRQLVIPVVLILVVARNYLHAIPTGGNDLVLIGGLVAIGATLGVLCGLFTHLRLGTDRVALARAGWAAVCLWVAGMATRMLFAFAASNGAGPAIQRFSSSSHITSGQAWIAAFVLMAMAEATMRLATIYTRARRLARI